MADISPLKPPERGTGADPGASGSGASVPERRRGIFLLPNLFTTAALFAGFYAIVAGMNHRFEDAAAAIFVAMVLDGMDGRIARMTNTQSDFGAEYDSLSDMVSFGLAPALVAYQWQLVDLGKLGWGASFMYAAAAALRLARFNTQIGIVDKRYFQGLPSPAAAALIAGFVWVCEAYALQRTGGLVTITCVLTVMAAALMVSNIRYHSFKQLDLRGRVPFVQVLAVALAFAFVLLDPPLVLSVGFALYAMSGPLLTLGELQRRRSARRRAAAQGDGPPKQ